MRNRYRQGRQDELGRRPIGSIQPLRVDVRSMEKTAEAVERLMRTSRCDVRAAEGHDDKTGKEEKA
ncbi:MAG: hypothetical protein ABIH92_01585 [Nanoarchaeota archaeon]